MLKLYAVDVGDVMDGTATVKPSDAAVKTPDFAVTDDGECVGCGVETENCDGIVLWCPECGKSCPLNSTAFTE